VAAPLEPWVRGRNGEALRVVSGTVSIRAEEGRLEALDLARGEAVLWVDAPERVPWYEQAAPLQAMLHTWAASRGLRLVHGGAVGRPDGCLLLVGRSGAGKSTTALASLRSSLRYLADDFCLVRPDDLTVFSLYSSAKTTSDTLARLPWLARLVIEPPPGEKAIAFLHDHVPEHLLDRAPLRGIVVPRITDEPGAALVPASRALALAELTPGSIGERRGLREEAFRQLAAITVAVPCHVLQLGRDPGCVPELLAGLLDA
jgi:hypothetical protein